MLFTGLPRRANALIAETLFLRRRRKTPRNDAPYSMGHKHLIFFRKKNLGDAIKVSYGIKITAHSIMHKAKKPLKTDFGPLKIAVLLYVKISLGACFGKMG